MSIDNSLNNLNRPYVFKGWYPQGFIDQFIRKVPFQRLEQPTAQVGWNVTGTTMSLSGAAFYSPGSAPPGLTVDFKLVPKPFQRLGETLQVDNLAETASGNTNDLLEAAIQAAKISLIRTLGVEIFVGTGTPPDLNGLGYEVNLSGNQFNVTSSGLPSYIDLLQLVNMVRASDGAVGGGADCIVTHERVIRYIVSEFFRLGVDCDMVYDADLGVTVPRFRGVPMYAGQVPLTSGTYDIFALKMSGPCGIRVVHATGRSDQFGIDVAPIPMQATLTQVGAYVGGFYALMVPEDLSIARLQGTTSAALGTNTTGAGIAVLP